ncbi:cation-transporting P-type ATPase [Geminicoccus roseus]|uniref:cation-transporting P-type ATPase n=1 Tax=Geminicoccus roseus TaxID=404900 RepID=UPI0004112756|nr:cation-transporting P-type ATPase [Geminicoccus roseus]
MASARDEQLERPDRPEASAWHALPAEDVLGSFAAARSGLSSEEARRRLAEHGPNSLPEPATRHPLLRFLAQFDNALIYFLLAAAAAAVAIGHHVDAAVIVAVVLINALVGFVQEGRAEEALAAIRQMISPQATVLREGRRRAVPVHELVPGDMALLEAGDRVPADLRLVRARGLLVDEAALTGESVAAEKDERPVEAGAALGDRRCMVYSGTLVLAGQGSGVVAATGSATEIGHISRLIGSVQQLTTPLLRQIDHFATRFTWVALVGSALLFAFAVLLRGYHWSEALMAVVAVSVGLIPEGLPAVITITLAVGVRRMAARNAVVRRLPAVETLGATSVICSDKTGTLTRNEMTARQVVTPAGRLEAAGSGYAPEGGLAEEGGGSVAASLPLLQSCVLCNDAELHEQAGQWSVNGDPMEGALVALAMKAGLDPAALRRGWPRLDEIPFDAQHRFMATLHQGPDGEIAIFVKGAPERLLAMAARQAGPDGGEQPVDHRFWTEAIASAAAEGERVLGFAAGRLDKAPERLAFGDLDGSLVFLGIVGFIDPPRDEALAAIAECRSAGIDVKMITGDHGATAGAIARQLGLAEAPEVVTGSALDGLGEQDLRALAKRAAVFARTSPEHKLRIVQALQQEGQVVAMTGDGVNDAPSLKQADVGVAMGRKGTEAAKEAAEMVLLDDNFASIVAAVHEGRTVYDNIQKVIAWTLPTNGGEALAVIAAILFGFTMPMTAAQILWINLVTAVTLGLALAFEPAEAGVMARPPRRAGDPLLSPFLLWRVVLVSLLFTGAALGVFFHAQSRGYDLEMARTLVVNTLVVLEIFYLFSVRYLNMTSITLKGMLGTRSVLVALTVVILAQLGFTYLPVMHALFDSRPVAIGDGLMILALGVALLLVLEAEKAVLRRAGVIGRRGGRVVSTAPAP